MTAGIKSEIYWLWVRRSHIEWHIIPLYAFLGKGWSWESATWYTHERIEFRDMFNTNSRRWKSTNVRFIWIHNGMLFPYASRIRSWL